MTVTAAVAFAVPPLPVQLSVNVVFAESAPLVAVPLADCPPDQPPDAVHDVALLLVHDSWVFPPLVTLVGFALRLTVGGGLAVTVTVFESLPVPPTPMQVSVNVVFDDNAALVALPTGGCVPDQPPDAVHDVAELVVHESCVVAPLATVAGLTVRFTVGGPTAATDLVSLAVPPLPVHVKVNVVFAESAPLVALPLAAFAPAQPPDAVHAVAFVLVHVSVVVPPTATVLGFTCRDTVGAG